MVPLLHVYRSDAFTIIEDLLVISQSIYYQYFVLVYKVISLNFLWPHTPAMLEVVLQATFWLGAILGWGVEERNSNLLRCRSTASATLLFFFNLNLAYQYPNEKRRVAGSGEIRTIRSCICFVTPYLFFFSTATMIEPSWCCLANFLLGEC